MLYQLNLDSNVSISLSLYIYVYLSLLVKGMQRLFICNHFAHLTGPLSPMLCSGQASGQVAAASPPVSWVGALTFQARAGDADACLMPGDSTSIRCGPMAIRSKRHDALWVHCPAVYFVWALQRGRHLFCADSRWVAAKSASTRLQSNCTAAEVNSTFVTEDAHKLRSFVQGMVEV